MPWSARFAAFAAALLAGLAAQASPGAAVDRILAANAPPPGVVFEVVTGDESELDRLLPVIHGHARRLRDRFPLLPIAVLTHGSEQFSLLTDNATRYGDLHRLVGTLEAEHGIPVQVCGNHAGFRDKGRADFPGYVDVVSTAPAKLDEYRAAGYVIIVM